MGSMQWQLGREMRTIPAFASRTQENQENLSRGGRSQDLPDSGFQPAVRHLSQVVRLSNDIHSTTHKHSTNTINIVQTRHSTNTNIIKKLYMRFSNAPKKSHVQHVSGTVVSTAWSQNVVKAIEKKKLFCSTKGIRSHFVRTVHMPCAFYGFRDPEGSDSPYIIAR